jgi:hypothetical protein
MLSYLGSWIIDYEVQHIYPSNKRGYVLEMRHV